MSNKSRTKSNPREPKPGSRVSLSGEPFVRSFAQHILPRGFQKVRYYGFMSPNSKLQLADARWLVWLWRGWTYWLGNPVPTSQAKPALQPCCQDLWWRAGVVGCDRRGGQANTLGNTITARATMRGLRSRTWQQNQTLAASVMYKVRAHRVQDVIESSRPVPSHKRIGWLRSPSSAQRHAPITTRRPTGQFIGLPF